MTPTDHPFDQAKSQDQWDGERIVQRITTRAVELHRHRHARRLGIMAGAVGMAAAVVIALVAVVLPGIAPDGASLATATATATATSSLQAVALREGLTGGFVLVAVIGFVLGTIVTLVCLKAARRLR